MLKTLKSFVPMPAKRRYWRMLEKCQSKYSAELSYWRRKFKEEGGQFRNSHYERLFLAMAGENDREFLRGRIVADFGCGPRGSLNWAVEAKARIGIDVLSELYSSEFGVRGHEMVYVVATETLIPLPSNYVDVMFSLNSLDHTNNFQQMCREIHRVIAPGGLLIASLNLEERRTKTEPQTLTEDLVRKYLLRGLQVASYRVAIKGAYTKEYEDMIAGNTVPTAPRGIPSALWVRALKPAAPNAPSM